MKIRKKLLSGILAAAVALTCLPGISAAAADREQEMYFESRAAAVTGETRMIEAQAKEAQTEETQTEDAVVRGSCGENVSYELDLETGRLSVSGSGAMIDYPYASDSPFYPYVDYITSIEVAEGVTSIGTLSFAFCFGAERVYLPDTLTSIGKQAFLGCVSLQALAVPDTVTEIGDYALGYSCNNGKEGAYQKTGLTVIGMGGSAAETYAQKNELTFAAVDAFTHSCGENATWDFDMKTGILKISGEGAVSDYSIYSYYGEQPEFTPYRDYVSGVVVEDGITAVGSALFYNFQNITKAKLSDTITKIGQSAFFGCASLENIVLPDTLAVIGQSAFSDCYRLKSIVIPQGTSQIGSSVFSGCSRLEKIEVMEENASFSSDQGALFDKEQKILLVFPEGFAAASFAVPDTVTSVAQNAFSGSPALKSLLFEGNAPSGFLSSRQNLNGLTIYYHSGRNWESFISTIGTANIIMKDMSELTEQTALTMGEGTRQLDAGQSMQLSAKINPHLASEFVWSSSDEEVAVVSGQGKVTAVNPGSAEIRVASADGSYTAQMPLDVTGEPFSMPLYEQEDFAEGMINYTSIYRTAKQIVSETLHGIYFLEDKKLGFYSFVNREYQVVETFAGCDDAYEADGKLYLLYQDICTVYDLTAQSVDLWFKIDGYKTAAVGADAKGRIYISGYSKYNAGKKVILLFSGKGEPLSSLPVGASVYAFSGFDESNGCFYMESYYDYYSWGYSHPGTALTMGRTDGDRLRYVDTYYSFLESGMISRSMSCLLFLCQDSYMEHQTSAELLGGRYLAAASVLHGAVRIYDSNAAGEGSLPQVMSIGRTAAEPGAGSSYYDLSSIGVRTVYNEKKQSIVIYENNKTISEYSLQTGEKLASFTTQHNVFQLLKMGDSLIAIEKENNAYFMEILDWGEPTQLQIRAEQTQMQVGTSQKLALESDKKYTLFSQWSSSDSSIVSVTGDGRLAAWKEGTAIITAQNTEMQKAEITITVSASGAPVPEENSIRADGTLSMNRSANNYQVYGKTVNSYLTENENGTLTRVEYIPEKGVVAETYSNAYELLESKTLPCELRYFGGYYAGSSANFLVFGEKNEAESDEAEALRIVKYSKEWERLGETSVKGANTYIPFDAGSLRMAETGGLLYLYTCHEMYAGSDSLHHQSNMTFVVDEDSMELTQSFFDVLNIAQAGYVSHSFNQFIKTDGTYVFRADHGDANPRAVSLTRCEAGGKITNVSYVLPFPISGTQGYNATGVSVGGLELSSDNCLIAGNSVDQNNYSAYGQRNIFVTVTKKTLNDSHTVWLTDYPSDSSVTPYTPHIVKLGEEQFLVMWEEYDSASSKTTVNMVTLDAEGNKTSAIVKTGLQLSDCVPLLTSDGLVKWYVTDGQSVNFYVINPYQLSAIKGGTTETETETETGTEETETESCAHVWDTQVTRAAFEENGSIVERCSQCGEEKSRTVIDAVETIALSCTSYTYNGKAKKPVVTVKDSQGRALKEGTDYTAIVPKNAKNAGRYTVTVLLQGNYEGEGTKTFDIVPKKTSISKVTAKKKGFTVKWKKQSAQTTGYEIAYSTSSKFAKKNTETVTVKKSKTVSKTISKLKAKKKYYVKVRTYKTVKFNGKSIKLYSGWSKVKTVKTKK